MNKVTNPWIEKASVVRYAVGKSVKSTIVDINPFRILLQLEGGLTGIITRREFGGSFSELESVEPGAMLEAVVINDENDEGLVVLSLRRASQDSAWADLNQIKEKERNIKVKIYEANKGGLMGRYKGLKAFLPVSQLAPLNYPRVEGADSGQILAKLQGHVGKEFVVQVMTLDREEGKIIISEKAAHAEKSSETLANLHVGDRMEGVVSGVVKFGIFVAFGGVEGLVHVSELDWSHVANPSKKFSIGDKVEVLVIGIDGEKLSFSIKQLTEDPWIEKSKAFSVGEEVQGKVVRWNDNGVFIDINEDIQGMFLPEALGAENAETLSGVVWEGKNMKGKIREINTTAHRLELDFEN